MKRIIPKIALIALLLFAARGVQAKIKITDRSAKKTPVWVNSSQPEYIITSAIAGDLETARNLCLENVRRYVIESVAENVKSTTEGYINQQSINNEIVHFLDEYTNTYQTQAADVPFLKGISASRIEEYYWEKREDKSNKSVSYLYAIKYPFPRIELKQMIYEFEKRDAEIYGKYTTLLGQIDQIASLEQIDRAILELGPVIDYLFDDTRKNAATSLRERYRALYNNVTFRENSNILGEYRFSLMLDGKPITTSQRLSTQADCAEKVTAESRGEEIVVKYNYDNCLFNDKNSVTVTLRIGGKPVKNTFYFTVKKYDVAIWPDQTAYLTAVHKTDTLLTDIQVRIHMQSKHDDPYLVRSMTLDVPGLGETLFLDDLNIQLDKRTSNLQVTWNGSIPLPKSQNNRLNMLKGSMEIEIPEEGILKHIQFSLPFRANW